MLKHLTGSTQSAEGSAPDQQNRRVLELKNVGLSEIKLTPLRRVAAGRRGRKEVLGNLNALARVILWPSSIRDIVVTQTILDDITVALPAGITVGVLATKPAARRAFLDIASKALNPDSGTVRREGRVASLGQAWALVSPYYSCRENLELLGRLLGVTKADYRKAMEAVEGFDAKFRVLDLPLRRTPPWVFDDYALVLIAELKFDILIAPEAMLPTSEPIVAYWAKYLQTVNERDQVILLGSRRSADLLTMASHLLLLDETKLAAFGPVEEVMARHEELVETALTAREERTAALPVFDEEEDDEDEELDQDEEVEPEITGMARDERDEEARPSPRVTPLDEDLHYQLSEISPDDRTSPLVEIIRAGPGEYSRLLLPDGRDAGPRPDDELVPPQCAKLPVIYREEGGIVRLVVETKEPELWVHPAIYLRRRKVMLLRSSAPELYVPAPARISFDVTLPPNLLQSWVFGVTAIVGVVNRTRDLEGMAITRTLATFANVAREGREWQPVPDPEPFRHAPETRERQIEEDPRYRIVSLALEDVSGEKLHHDVKGYHSVDAAERGFHIVFDVYVAAESIKLVFVVDLKSRRTIFLRLAPVERVLAPGSHRITVVVPAGLLTNTSYEISVAAMEPDQVGKAEPLATESEVGTVLRVSGSDAKRNREPWFVWAPLDMKLKWTESEAGTPREKP
jgi:homopolymeric O-antigen transport system ATP-binding protein